MRKQFTSFLKSPNFKIFKYVLILFIGWRMTLIILTFYGVNILPTQNRTTNSYFSPSSANYWEHWAYWDSVHILKVVESGYIVNSTPFFPLYPILIRILGQTGLSAFWAGFIIAQVAAIFAIFFLYKLVLMDYGEKLAKNTILLLLIFPSSFYLAAVYSESLFLALSVSAFYYARKKSWLLASILAGLSAATRLIGVAVIISIFTEYFFTKIPEFKIKYLYNTFLKRFAIYSVLIKLVIDWLINSKFTGYGLITGVLSSLSVYADLFVWLFLVGVVLFYIFKFFDFYKLYSVNTLYLLTSTIPLTLYMFYLYVLFNEPLAFLKGHENWGRHLTLPFNTVINHLRMMQPDFLSSGIKNQLQLEFIVFLLLSVFFILGLYKLRFSYITYFALSILIPISSGKLMSMPRIALVVFPMFIVITQIKNENFRYSWIFSSIIFLAILTILYFNNFWVA